MGRNIQGIKYNAYMRSKLFTRTVHKYVKNMWEEIRDLVVFTTEMYGILDAQHLYNSWDLIMYEVQ